MIVIIYLHRQGFFYGIQSGADKSTSHLGLGSGLLITVLVAVALAVVDVVNLLDVDDDAAIAELFPGQHNWNGSGRERRERRYEGRANRFILIDQSRKRERKRERRQFWISLGHFTIHTFFKLLFMSSAARIRDRTRTKMQK